MTSSQHRCIEIVGGFKMPFVLSFTADPAMAERLKSLLSLNEKYFSPTAEGGAYDIFLGKTVRGRLWGQGR